MNRHIVSILLSLALPLAMSAQHKISESMEIDKTVHNFGEIMMDEGPVTCTFTLKNIGQKPSVIYNVATSCGCTDVKWTREPVRPGGKGTITATYSNDEGAYPFDKSLTVYLSDSKKPVILKLRGTSLAKKLPLEKLYEVRYGPLGLKNSSIKCGNLEQGGVKSESALVANLSSQPLKVEFRDVSEGLKISLSPNPIPARSTAELSFTVTASRQKWGKNHYNVTPVMNGKKYRNAEGDEYFSIWAFTKENFSSLTPDDKARGPRPKLDKSTFEFGKVKRGTVIHAIYDIKNEGKEDLVIYKADADAAGTSTGTIPVLKPAESAKFTVDLDTSSMPEGEALVIVTLTTNSPLRPIVNLFLAGWLE